ncbi:Rieske (2Fe-2S) protein [Gemmatimonas phototrophica]|uniref:Rieske domain-containing protein n=1 Tax=Gemmatimonas phototrophica TaxID=1379270 RepID=A0A143BLU8_9BACT|nr:Rieske (2Fe-2S) protein [Gemmatimonas phototrophica]AMW05492.1 hypothetical protein GEMMAAP_13120 [Gemmatimonas phototrophica]
MAAVSIVATACGGGDGETGATGPSGTGGGGGSTPPGTLPAGVTRSGNVFTIDLSVNNELSSAGLFVLSGGAVPALVVRAAADTYRAFDARCPHAGTSNQWEFGNGVLQCNNHGSRFAASSGALNAGPATTGLRALVVTRAGSTLTVSTG